MIFHGYQWQGTWTGMHAYSKAGDGRDWQLSRRADGRGAFQTNVTWADGSWTKFYRRERPELHFDAAGNPNYFYSGIEYGMDHPRKQYSFTIVQQVRGGQP